MTKVGINGFAYHTTLADNVLRPEWRAIRSFEA